MQSKDQVYDLARLRKTMLDLRFLAHINDPAACIATHCADVYKRLDTIGYGESKTGKLKHIITNSLERVRLMDSKKSYERVRQSGAYAGEERLNLLLTLKLWSSGLVSV